MKKVIYSALLLSFAGILATGCEKEEFERQDNENVSESSKITLNRAHEETVLGSAKNPYNNIGILHNEILAGVRDQFDVSHSRGEIYEYIVEYTETDLGYSDAGSTLAEGGLNDQIISYEAGPDFYAEVEGWLAEELVSERQYNYLTTILDINSSNPCTDCNLDEAAEIAIKNIGEVENTIIEDEELTSTQKKSLLIYSAVNKYSIDFWTKESQMEHTSYSISLVTDGGTGEDFPSRIPWYAADAAGAWTTFQVGGGWLAAFGGPVAVIAGTLIGGAASSVFASL